MEQLVKIEAHVQNQINSTLPVYSKVLPKDVALSICSIRAVFGETYPDPVRVITVGADIDEVVKDPKNEKWFTTPSSSAAGRTCETLPTPRTLPWSKSLSISKGVRRIVGVTGEEAIVADNNAQHIIELIENAMLIDKSQPDAAQQIDSHAKQIKTMIDALPIPISYKSTIDESHKNLIKKISQYKKLQQKQQQADIANEIKSLNLDQSQPMILLHKIKTNSVDLNKSVGLIQKQLPKNSSLVLFNDDLNKNRCNFIILVNKVHQEQHFDGSELMKSLKAECGANGGGKPSRVMGSCEIAQGYKALTLCSEYLKSKNL